MAITTWIFMHVPWMFGSYAVRVQKYSRGLHCSSMMNMNTTPVITVRHITAYRTQTCALFTVMRSRKTHTDTLQPTLAKQYAISQNHQYCVSLALVGYRYRGGGNGSSPPWLSPVDGLSSPRNACQCHINCLLSSIRKT